MPPHAAAPASGTPSIRRLLARLLAWALVPASVAMLGLVANQYQRDRERLAVSMQALARVLGAAVEERRERAGSELTVLAARLAQANGAPELLRDEALRAADVNGLDHVVLIGPGGRVLVDTRLGAGGSRPTLPADAADEAPQAGPGQPVVRGLSAAGAPAATVRMRTVLPDGRAFLIDKRIDAAAFLQLLRREQLPDGWIVAIVDAQGKVVARTLEHERFVGRDIPAAARRTLAAAPEGVVNVRAVDGTPVVTAFQRLPSAGWWVVVSVPRQQLYGAVARSAAYLGLVMLVVVALSAAIAWRLSGRIVDAVRQLRQAADGLGTGRGVQLPPLAFREADELARSFEAASAHIQGSGAALAAGEERLRAIVETAMDAVVVTDGHGDIVLANQAAQRMFGHPREAMLGRAFLSLLAPQERAGVAERLAGPQGAVAGAGGAPLLLRGLHADGQVFTIEASVSAAGQQQLRTVIMRDVTERLRDQQALVRSNLELQQFAFVASHDLRSPLGTVKGFMSLLAKRIGADDARAHELIGRTIGAVDRMDRLTADLLAYARLQSQARPLEPVDCNEAVADALRLLEAAVQEAGARVSVGPLPTVPGDRTQLIQLFQNLIGNAVKYRRGAPEVEIGASRHEEGWLFRVADNGIGIEPQHLRQIFEIFKRLHTEHEYSGTGIGLAICQRIVERHGGRIWAASRPGAGSSLFFTLPAQPSEAP